MFWITSFRCQSSNVWSIYLIFLGATIFRARLVSKYTKDGEPAWAALSSIRGGDEWWFQMWSVERQASYFKPTDVALWKTTVAIKDELLAHQQSTYVWYGNAGSTKWLNDGRLSTTATSMASEFYQTESRSELWRYGEYRAGYRNISTNFNI